MEANNRSLFIFSFKLALIFILTFGLVKYLLFPFIPFLAHDKKYRYELKNLKEGNLEKLDIAFFGNSFVYTAYDPTVIKDRLGASAYHFNSSSQVLESSLLVAKHVLEQKSIKYAVFDVSKGSLTRPKIEKEKNWYFQSIALQEIPFSLDKYKKINAFFPKEVYFEYYINALSSSFGKVFQLNERAKFVNGFSNSFEYYHFKGSLFSERGYFAYDFNKKSITQEVFEKEFYRTPSAKINSEKLWNENLKKELSDFIAFAEKKGTKVVLINSLKLREEVYNTDFIVNLKSQFKNVEFVNLNTNRNKYNLNNLSFFDGSHLTYLGSYEVTNRLIDSLSSWDQIFQPKPISHDFKICNLKGAHFNFEKGRDAFIKLEFDRIPKKLKNHTLVLNIYPKDISLLSRKSLEKGIKHDAFHFKNIKEDLIQTGSSEIFIKRLNTNVTNDMVKNVKLFFEKKGDTLKIPLFKYYFE
jgi:hypothetical protein